MTIWKNNYASIQKQNNILEIQTQHAGLEIFFFFPHFQRNLQKNICRASKIFKTSNTLNNKKYV